MTTDGHPPGWYALCRASALGRGPLAVQFASRSLVAYRAADGSVAALEDRCAHRGTPLSAGRVDAGGLRCPYHGWAYAADGRLLEVPALGADQARRPPIRVHAVECVEQDGFVWGRFGEPRSARPHRFAHSGEPGWTSFTMRTRFAAPVDACLENFLDCPHATFVHKYWFRAPTARSVACVVRTRDDGAEAEFYDEPREKSAVWWLLAPRSGGMRHVDRFIAPNTSEVEYRFDNGWHYVITSTCTPDAGGGTLVHTVINFRFPFLGRLVRLFFEPLARTIIGQDVRMLDIAAAGSARSGARHADTEADLLAPHIRAWRRAMIAGDAPPPAGAEARLEIAL